MIFDCQVWLIPPPSYEKSSRNLGLLLDLFVWVWLVNPCRIAPIVLQVPNDPCWRVQPYLLVRWVKPHLHHLSWNPRKNIGSTGHCPACGKRLRYQTAQLMKSYPKIIVSHHSHDDLSVFVGKITYNPWNYPHFRSRTHHVLGSYPENALTSPLGPCATLGTISQNFPVPWIHTTT